MSGETPDLKARGWGVVGVLALGYIGIYLCRKNLAVAIPLLQDSLHVSKEKVGAVASAGTFAYAIGKFVNGPVVDRIGGRAGFLAALAAVALCGAAGAFAPSLGLLMLFYGLNRFAGAGAWGAMVKIVPTWFGTARTATAIAVLSLSYVLGGVAATLLGRQIVTVGGGWRAVMGLPSLALVALALICVFGVRLGPLHGILSAGGHGWSRNAVAALFRKRQFWVACGLSFTITLMRESFNVWSVDYLTSVQLGEKSVGAAALHSVGFDLAGAAAILVTGLGYDRVSSGWRRWIMVGTLAVLAVVLWALARGAVPGSEPWLIGLVGLLVYGPYSLLSGVLAVESGGAELAATSAGIIDGVGYVAAILAGAALGRLLDVGGYGLGFNVLAGLTVVSAILALGLRSGAPPIVESVDTAT